jgi:hypothetical protein
MELRGLKQREDPKERSTSSLSLRLRLRLCILVQVLVQNPHDFVFMLDQGLLFFLCRKKEERSFELRRSEVRCGFGPEFFASSREHAEQMQFVRSANIDLVDEARLLWTGPVFLLHFPFLSFPFLFMITHMAQPTTQSPDPSGGRMSAMIA